MRIDIGQLEYYHPTLRKLLLWIERHSGKEQTITSQIRIGDSGVHGTLPLRGTDLRCRDIGIGRDLETLINNNWQYDPSRPEMRCAILHGDGPHLHLHVQVHPKTVQPALVR